MTDAGKVSYDLMYNEDLETDLLTKFSRELVEDAYILSGTCPRCGHSTTMPVPTALATIPTAGMLSFAQSPPRGFPASKHLGYVERSGHLPDPYEVDLYCSCKVEHDPKQEKHGCGAWARLTVTLEADDGPQPDATQPAEDHPQPTDDDGDAN